MSKIKKPSELEPVMTLAALIYGQPGIGKTTLACSAPKPILFDFDGGAHRIDGSHQVDTVPVATWADALEALQEVKAAGEYKTVIIDTIGKMLTCIEDDIKATSPNLVDRSGNLSLKGFGKRKQMFSDFLREAKSTGLSLIYVAHELENRETKGGEQITIKRPDCASKQTVEIMKDIDLVGYMQCSGSQNRRTITFDSLETAYTKNTCGMHGEIAIPEVINSQGQIIAANDFMAVIIANYAAMQTQKQAQHVAYETLVKEISNKLLDVKDAASANAFVAYLGGVTHIWNSLEFARMVFKVKADELGLNYDKNAKQYV